MSFGTDEWKKSISIEALKDCGNESGGHFKYNFEVKGLYRNVEGRVKPDDDLIRGYPRSFKILNVQRTWCDAACSGLSNN